MAGRAFLVVVVVVFGAMAIAGSWLGQRMTEAAKAVGALEPRHFDALTLVAVGTGGAYENPMRRGPCMAIGIGDRVVLVDAGRGVTEGLRASQIPVHQADTVYLTSLLPENTVGLDDLLLTGWLAPRTHPLRIVGPSGTRALVEGLLTAHRDAIAAQASALALPVAGATALVVEAGDGWAESGDSLDVRAVEISTGALPTLAYRFEGGNRVIVASGAGPAADAVAELARGAHLLVHEAYFEESVAMAIAAGASDPERMRREAALHTPLGDAGRLAARAGVGTLVLTRLRPPPLFDREARKPVAEVFRGQIEIPADGTEITP